MSLLLPPALERGNKKAARGNGADGFEISGASRRCARPLRARFLSAL
jgi:hypothetical protein